MQTAARTSKRKKSPIRSHDFICLAKTDQSKAASAFEKYELIAAWLGKKCIRLPEDGYSAELHADLIDAFPKLMDGGGYELLRVSDSGRSKGLEMIPVPSGGYTASYLKDVAQQAKIYIRPIQRHLSLEPVLARVNVN